MAVIELRFAARVGMINSGCKKSSRQPVKMHPVNLSCPGNFSFSQADVQMLKAQTKLEFLLRDVVLSHVPKSDPAHHANASVVKHLQSPPKILSQAPRLTSIQQQLKNQAPLRILFERQFDELGAKQIVASTTQNQQRLI